MTEHAMLRIGELRGSPTNLVVNKAAVSRGAASKAANMIRPTSPAKPPAVAPIKPGERMAPCRKSN